MTATRESEEGSGSDSNTLGSPDRVRRPREETVGTGETLSSSSVPTPIKAR